MSKKNRKKRSRGEVLIFYFHNEKKKIIKPSYK